VVLPHRKKAEPVIAEFLVVFRKILFVEKEMEQEWII